MSSSPKTRPKKQKEEVTLPGLIAKEIGIEPEDIEGIIFLVQYRDEDGKTLRTLKSDTLTPWETVGWLRKAEHSMLNDA